MNLGNVTFACGSNPGQIDVRSSIYLVAGGRVRCLRPGQWKFQIVGSSSPDPKWAISYDQEPGWSQHYSYMEECFLIRSQAYRKAEQNAHAEDDQRRKA